MPRSLPRATSLLLLGLTLLAVFFGLRPASAQTPLSTEPTRVVVLGVEGGIDRTMISYLDDRLTSAEEEGAVVVLQIDTPGTIDQDGLALAERVANLTVPVIAWVGPAPAKATGAGMLLMYASSLAAVSPGSQTGPLEPLDLAHPDQVPDDLQATIEGWIEARDKDTQLIRQDEALPGAAAMDLGIATAAASSVPQLLDEVDGREVQTADGPVILRTAIATDEQQAKAQPVQVTFDGLGPIQRVAHAVASPSMIYFLLVIGLACLAFELTQPGFGFAGFAGAGMVALGVYGLWVVPPWWPGMLLLLGGIALMTLDVRRRRLGAVTVAGVLAFAAGSILAWKGTAPAMGISPWLIGGAVIASILYYGFALTVAIQSRDRIVNTQRGLIGLTGEARGTLSPEGPVYVKGALWRGRSASGEIAAGTPVRVRGVDGLVLRVEAEPGAPDAPSANGELLPG
jgi:membrane-bound serine protease (ClpP class)